MIRQFDDLGPYLGHPRDPRTPELGDDEMECEECGAIDQDVRMFATETGARCGKCQEKAMEDVE